MNRKMKNRILETVERINKDGKALKAIGNGCLARGDQLIESARNLRELVEELQA